MSDNYNESNLLKEQYAKSMPRCLKTGKKRHILHLTEEGFSLCNKNIYGNVHNIYLKDRFDLEMTVFTNVSHLRYKLKTKEHIYGRNFNNICPECKIGFAEKFLKY